MDAALARTRRERRQRHTDVASPQPGHDLGDRTPAEPEKTSTSASPFSVRSLFAESTEELPDVQPNILTVCTGNICRSPLAETVLATRLADLDLRVHSAGTQALVGHGMPTLARELAERNGVPPVRAGGHKARLLTESLLQDADLVLTMSAQHSTTAVQLVPRRLHRTFTLREFARLAATLDDGALHEAAKDAGNPRSRFSALVRLVSDQRGVAPRAVDDEDVIDPYRRSAEVYAQSEAQLIPALAQVERVVRIALQG
ncbi:low molecular weight phosphatase family protein [Microbacterium sp. NPDC058345]|uniref:arsenate reductase/protein-tyrosine-phosphatase family protein n=1 Tax=Microbacterium sp. NPDC058345 TaxID=3346455 RepID=UPI00365C8FBE